MSKHKRKHIVTHYRGKPVKPKTPRRTERGRPRIHPIDANKPTMIRSTEGERLLWESAARYESQMLNLPHGSELSLNGWILRALNERASLIAAHANGVYVDEKRVAEIETHARASD
jgi:hypothetical protein